MAENTFWKDQFKWPSDPPEWLFLARAAVELANTMYGEWGNTGFAERERLSWLNSFLSTQIARNAHKDPDQANKQDRNLGKLRADMALHNERCQAVQERLRQWAEESEIRTGTRPTMGGRVTELEPVTWSTQRLSNRFYCCQMDPRKPFALGIAGDRYQHIFVHRGDFERMNTARPTVLADKGIEEVADLVADELEIRWIPLSEAVDRLYVKYGSSPTAANAIKGMGIAGAIRTKASNAVQFEPSLMGDEGAIAETFSDWPISQNLWTGIQDFGVSNDGWLTNTVKATVGALGQLRTGYRLVNIQVDAGEIERLMQELADKPLTISEELRRGTHRFAHHDPLSAEAAVPRPLPSSPDMAREDAIDSKVVPFISTGMQGRKTAKLAIDTIFAERGRDGHRANGVTAEAKALVEAYNSDPRFPRSSGWPAVSATTVENHIRDTFWREKRQTEHFPQNTPTK